MIKVSFTGDIMCEKPFLKAVLGKGRCDFRQSFSEVAKLLMKSDYVIGNLETPVAGEAAGYTSSMFSFNTPEQFVSALIDSGVTGFITANNHCTDRGIDGLTATLDVLDRKGIPHTGTHRTSQDNQPLLICDSAGTIAVISCTDSTNSQLTGVYPDKENVNLLCTQAAAKNLSVSAWIKRSVKRIVGPDLIIDIKRLLGCAPRKIYIDDDLNTDDIEKHIAGIGQQILDAGEKADIVVVCPHMGGQFNTKAGKRSEYIIERLLEYSPDAIIASHPHVVQKIALRNGIHCAYSLGNFSMSLSTKYILREDYPELGMLYHFYIDEGKIVRTAFSLILMKEAENGSLCVIPANIYYNRADIEEKKQLKNKIRKVLSIIYDTDLGEYDVIPEEFPTELSKLSE